MDPIEAERHGVDEPNREHPAPVGGDVDTLWTVPNLFTLARLLCLPLFVWLLFGLHARQAAAWTLGALGATDWVDGYLARRLHQTSAFGKKFDPTVDRMLFLVAVVSIMVDGSMPIWFGVAILVREVFVATMMVTATMAFGMKQLDVTWLGKSATFLLMFAVPGFLLGASDIAHANAWRTAAWVLGIPGLILSYYTAFDYIGRVLESVRAARSSSS